MSSILDAVRQQLGPDTIQQISSTLGADPAATNNAVSLALPALLGGLSQNAAQPQGAAALDNALNAHDGSILDNLGGLLGGGGGGGGLGGGIGGAILGHIFGNRRSTVEQGVGHASGLDAAQIAQLMTMLAPIVRGVLGRMKRSNGLDANRLPDVLQQSHEQGRKEVQGNDVLSMGASILGGIFGNKD